MATSTITRGTTLPNSGSKTELHNLIDTATVTISNIVNTDVSATAAIAGTKISPNFGSQNVVTTGTLGAGATTLTSLDAGTSCEANAYTLGGVATNAAGGIVTQDSTGIVKGKRCGAVVTSYSKNTIYQAPADGIVECILTVTSSGLGRCIGFSGATASPPPATERGATEPSSGFETPRGSFSFRVNKGDFWWCIVTNGGGSQTAIINFTPEGD